MSNPELVLKLNAGRRQLATAIELWFHDKDDISIHTLACASYEVIHDVSKNRGRKRDLLLDSIMVKDEYTAQFKAYLRKPANFFKHADNDPEGTIDFYSELTEVFMVFAIAGLETIGVAHNQHELAFFWWITLHRPNALTQYGYELIAKEVQVETIRDLKRMNKKQLFDMFLAKK